MHDELRIIMDLHSPRFVSEYKIELKDTPAYNGLVLDSPEFRLPEGFLGGRIAADIRDVDEGAESEATIRNDTANSYLHREVWLYAVAEQLRPIFVSHDAIIPENIRITCGFPSTRAFSPKRQRLGECWPSAASKDGHIEIMISPVVDHPMRVAGVLAHELVHATVGVQHGHRKPFRKLAEAIGLEGRMTAMTEGAAFKEALTPILEAIGPYPHAELCKTVRRRQGTGLLRLQCPTCPYTVWITRKWLDEVGAPACPSHGQGCRND